MPQAKLWLYDWIDTFGIKTVSQAESLINDPGLRKDLQKRAADVPFTLEKIERTEAPTVVAGAVGYTIAAGQKFMEEKRDIALSDMYFLWQAQEHSKNHK